MIYWGFNYGIIKVSTTKKKKKKKKKKKEKIVYRKFLFVVKTTRMRSAFVDNMSATDEDNELRDLLVQTLESNGTLSKLRVRKMNKKTERKRKYKTRKCFWPLHFLLSV